MATRNVKIQIDLGIRRLVLIPALLGILVLGVLIYGHISIAGNERLSLVTQGLVLAREMETAGDGGQSKTDEWVMRFVDMTNSQGKQTKNLDSGNAVAEYVETIDYLITDKIRQAVRERVALEVQVNHLRYPEADPYKLIEAIWHGTLLQYTVLPAVTVTPTPTLTPTPVPTPAPKTGIVPVPPPPTPAFQPERKPFWLWEPEWWGEQLPDGSFLAVCAVIGVGIIVMIGAVVAYFKNWI